MNHYRYRPHFKNGTSLADVGLRGERRISCFANDTFHSLCGRFSVVSRNIFTESRIPLRFYPQTPAYDPHVIELRVDGVVIAKIKDLTLGINWILLKLSRNKISTAKRKKKNEAVHA